MFFLDLFRSFKFALQSLWRNFWLTIVTVIIVTLAMASVSFLLIFNLVANNVVDTVKAKSEIYIDLTEDAKQAQVEFLVAELNKLEDIREVIYITPSETLDRFKEEHKNDEVIIASLESLSANPFTGSLKLSVNDISKFDALLTELSRDEYGQILEINNSEFYEAKDLLNVISDYSKKIEKLGFGISLFFVLISIIVVFNTIQMGIYSHREEIGIMKLVGASNWFVRSPFIIESILYSIISVVVMILIFYPLAVYVQPHIDNFLGEYTLDLVASVSSNFLWVFGLEIGIAILITVLSSLFATRRYLDE
ncbi:ABC transporter permease [Patescibacteria group bacterium]|nr:ABC transporter permease [Patescibacteria group bacterium]